MNQLTAARRLSRSADLLDHDARSTAIGAIRPAWVLAGAGASAADVLASSRSARPCLIAGVRAERSVILPGWSRAGLRFKAVLRGPALALVVVPRHHHRLLRHVRFRDRKRIRLRQVRCSDLPIRSSGVAVMSSTWNRSVFSVSGRCRSPQPRSARPSSHRREIAPARRAPSRRNGGRARSCPRSRGACA